MEIEIYKSEPYETPLWFNTNSAMCPVCGVISNPYPCYEEGKGTSMPHRMSYCDHPLETDIRILFIGEPKRLP